MGNRYRGALADCGAQLEPLGLLCGSFCFADFLLSFSLTLKKYFLLGKESFEDIF